MSWPGPRGISKSLENVGDQISCLMLTRCLKSSNWSCLQHTSSKTIFLTLENIDNVFCNDQYKSQLYFFPNTWTFCERVEGDIIFQWISGTTLTHVFIFFSIFSDTSVHIRIAYHCSPPPGVQANVPASSSNGPYADIKIDDAATLDSLRLSLGQIKLQSLSSTGIALWWLIH